MVKLDYDSHFFFLVWEFKNLWKEKKKESYLWNKNVAKVFGFQFSKSLEDFFCNVFKGTWNDNENVAVLW